MVPALFLMVCTQAFYAIDFFAPMSPSCLEHYYHKATNTTPGCMTWWGKVRYDPNVHSDFYSPFPTTFGRKLLELFIYPSPQQAWFCIYLFVYSQVMAFNFSNWHSKNGEDGSSQTMCCGKTNLSILKKPFSMLAKAVCCMCVCFLPSSSPGEFSKAIRKVFLGAIKLPLVPGFCLSLIEIVLRWYFPDGQFHAFSFLFDWCNNVHFLFIYFMGYAIMAEDDHGFAEVMKKYRWLYLFVGTVFLAIYVAIALMAEEWFKSFDPQFTPYILKCIFRGLGEWIFIIGLYSVNRHLSTRSHPIIKTMRAMAMPFYLLHQQVLIVLVSGTLWVPYLGSFPATIILTTICTCIISFLVAKSPGPIKYLFGLPSKHNIIPGEKLSGFLPVTILSILFVVEAGISNIIIAFI